MKEINKSLSYKQNTTHLNQKSMEISSLFSAKKRQQTSEGNERKAKTVIGPICALLLLFYNKTLGASAAPEWRQSAGSHFRSRVEWVGPLPFFALGCVWWRKWRLSSLPWAYEWPCIAAESPHCWCVRNSRLQPLPPTLDQQPTGSWAGSSKKCKVGGNAVWM